MTWEGDTATAVAQYLLSGTVYDQRQRPVARASVAGQPAVLNQARTGSGGQFALGLADQGTYAVTAAHPLYGPLPPMKGLSVDGNLEGVELFLPPRENLILNGDFELPGEWEAVGVVPPAPVPGMGHTGDFALRLGELPDRSATEFPWTWTIKQTVSVPDSDEEITLDWLYRVDGVPRQGDELVVTVQGSSEMAESLSLSNTAWAHQWIDVSAFAGQQVTVDFTLYRRSDTEPLTVWLDEVGLGTNTASYMYMPLMTQHASP